MSKLRKFQKWIGLAEAGTMLSESCGERIGELELLRLALEGHANLSVRFINFEYAKRGKIVSKSEVSPKFARAFDDAAKTVTLWGGIEINDNEVILIDDEIFKITDVWDLPMLGGELFSVQSYYEKLHFRDSVDKISIDGAFVRGENEEIFQLQVRQETPDANQTYYYIPMHELPRESELVIRTAEVTRLESILGGAQDSPQFLEDKKFVSDDLKLLYLAAERFWGKAEISNRQSHMKNAVVAGWLVKNGFSQKLADAGATIIRPDWAGVGRPPEQ